MPNPVCSICHKAIEAKVIIIDGKTAHEVEALQISGFSVLKSVSGLPLLLDVSQQV
jgi:hypothetical protein